MVSELQLHGHHPGFGGAGRLYLGADEGHPHAARVGEEVEDLGGRTGQGMALGGGQQGGESETSMDQNDGSDLWLSEKCFS